MSINSNEYLKIRKNVTDRHGELRNWAKPLINKIKTSLFFGGSILVKLMGSSRPTLPTIFSSKHASFQIQPFFSITFSILSQTLLLNYNTTKPKTTMEMVKWEKKVKRKK